ncbi:E3 ubiquitin-protein ligase RNF123-like [Sycon ciliatum]|uniref:E3 ubiquitin-protein ligase RNF123-like n=1 Tax=Sycon ciliatum TaxID=27933 RepID=UPI0031F6AC08
MSSEERQSALSRSPIAPKTDLPVGLECMLYKRDGVVSQGSTPQSFKDCNAAAMDQVLSHVLAPLLQCSDNPDRPVLNLLNCSGHITRLVHLLLETCHAHPLPWLEQRDAAVDGRIGSRYTELLSADRKSSTAFDGNEVYSATSLKSCWANTCVFKGRWQFEVSLMTSGDIRLGWSCNARAGGTYLLSFPDKVMHETCHYTYSGRRKLKFCGGQWNYGVEWLDGDVIGCLIDMDAGTVSYSRNGDDLGMAFDCITRGASHAYMPYVSAPAGEKCIVNFGGRPLRYPSAGYKPLVDGVPSQFGGASTLLECLHRLAVLGASPPSSSAVPVTSSLLATATAQIQDSLAKVTFIVGHHLFVPFLSAYFQRGVHSYLIPSQLIPFLLQLDGPVTAENSLAPRPILARFLEMMSSLLDVEHLAILLKYITEGLHLVHGFSPLCLDLQPQLSYAVVLLEMLRNARCRSLIVTDTRIRFSDWLGYATNGSIPEPGTLKDMIPVVWWEGCQIQDEQHNKQAYEQITANLVRQCAVLDKVHESICKALLQDEVEDGDMTFFDESSQIVVARELRRQVRMLPANPTADAALETSAITLLSGMAVPMVKALCEVWDELAADFPAAPKSKDLCLVDSLFYSLSGHCSEYTRLGGSLAHLSKEYAEALEEDAETFGEEEEELSEFATLISLADTILLIFHNWSCKDLILCSQCFHQIKELNSSMETFRELREKAGDSENFEGETLTCVDTYLQQTQSELERHSRTMACLRASTFSKDMCDVLAWACHVTMSVTARFLDKNELFGFLPEHYVRVMFDMFFCLRVVHHIVHDFFEREDADSLVKQLAQLICRVVPSKHVVLPDAHDMCTQYLSMFCCLPECRAAISEQPADQLKELYLHVMESLSDSNSHNWVQATVVATRLWMIPSFADHAVTPLLVAQPSMAAEEVVLFLETDAFSEYVTYPSAMTDKEVDLLKECLSDNVVSTGLLNSLLNRLNWSFSELVGIMQELQSSGGDSHRPDYERRLTRTCSFSFSLVVMFLRLIERIALLVPQVWVGKNHPTAAIMLPRLCQTLGQILTRFATRGSLFEQLPARHLAALPDVKAAYLLTACSGIFLSLTIEASTPDMQERGVQAIVEETSLELSILCQIIGVDVDEVRQRRRASSSTSNSSTSQDKNNDSATVAAAAVDAAEATDTPSGAALHNAAQDVSSQFHGFSLGDVEISKEDKHRIAQLADLIIAKDASLKEEKDGSESDENLCSICCAQSVSVKFVPCSHQSCMACISYQMMNDPRCFFCKVEVESFVSLTDEDKAAASSQDSSKETSSEQQQQKEEQKDQPITGSDDSEYTDERGMVHGSVEPPATVLLAENRFVDESESMPHHAQSREAGTPSASPPPPAVADSDADVVSPDEAWSNDSAKGAGNMTSPSTCPEANGGVSSSSSSTMDKSAVEPTAVEPEPDHPPVHDTGDEDMAVNEQGDGGSVPMEIEEEVQGHNGEQLLHVQDDGLNTAEIPEECNGEQIMEDEQPQLQHHEKQEEQLQVVELQAHEQQPQEESPVHLDSDVSKTNSAMDFE